MKKVLLTIFFTLILISIILIGLIPLIHQPQTKPQKETSHLSITYTPSPSIPSSPLSIQNLRQNKYPGSELKIIQTLNSSPNYKKYLTSYTSEGLTIYSLLTVPNGQKPKSGWPVILLNHGYIPPPQYTTETSYIGFVDQLSNAGYIVFKPDFRGNGNSQGSPIQPYVSPDYIIDSLNALSTIKNYPDTDPQRIATIGHSMGGNITLHELVITKEIKAAVILSGVVGSYFDILTWFDNRTAIGVLTTQNDQQTAQSLKQLTQENNTPEKNPIFWQSIDPLNFLSYISVPVQIQVGNKDEVVPPSFSISLKEKLQHAGKTVDFHEYPGADHNLSPYTTDALNQTITFLNTYLK